MNASTASEKRPPDQSLKWLPIASGARFWVDAAA